MENLIDFDDPQLELNDPKLWGLSNALGVIRRKCIAIRVDDNSSVNLKPGNLIQIIPEYQDDGYHFKIWNYNDKQQTVYMCSADDFITVNIKLWPYLFALKNDEEHVKFVENVYNGEFDMTVLNLDSKIRIRATPGSGIPYYEFIVTHIGVVEDYGTGYYIGLQLQNDLFTLTKDLEYLSNFYRFGGTGIVVTAYWVMLNIYKENKHDDWVVLDLYNEQACKETSYELQRNNSFDISMDEIEIAVEAKEIVLKDVRRPSTPFEESEKTNDTVIENTHRQSPEIGLSAFGTNMKDISPNGIEFEIFKNERRLSILNEELTKEIKRNYSNMEPQNSTTEIESMTNANGTVKNMKITVCDKCAEIVKKGCEVVLRDCLHTFCKECIRSYVSCNLKYSKIQCPYTKEYKCESHLRDVEIKDLGGDLVHNKILDNNSTEFMATEPNPRLCPNEACKIIWTSPQNKDIHYEQCEKCKIYWCFLCNSVHEPDERHDIATNGTKPKKAQQKFLGKQHAPASKSCAECHKTDILESEFITLKICGHAFCENCMLKTNTAKSKTTQCPTCRTKLNDNDLQKLIGLQVKMFHKNRNNPGLSLKK